MAWTVETLNDAVDAELEELPAHMRARFVYISRLIEEFGIGNVREPHGRDGISRAIYVTATGRRVVVVRVFVKKTRATPDREIVLAMERARGVQ